MALGRSRPDPGGRKLYHVGGVSALRRFWAMGPILSDLYDLVLAVASTWLGSCPPISWLSFGTMRSRVVVAFRICDGSAGSQGQLGYCFVSERETSRACRHEN